MADRQSQIKVLRALSPVACTATFMNGQGIPTANAGSVTFVVTMGAITITSGTVDITLQEGATSTPTGTVAAGFMVGVTKITAPSTLKVAKIGYIGNAAYVRVRVKPSSATGIIGAVALLENPRVTPQA